MSVCARVDAVVAVIHGDERQQHEYSLSLS